MKISMKGIYALEAMIEMASKGTKQCISIREISEKRNCSIKYLEQIFKELKLANLISSTRGKTGGYQIAKPITEITSKDIILAVEGKLDPVLCLSQTCPRESQCKTLPITIDVKVPYTITGPAIRNIFADIPKTIPSFLNSIAGETTEFAKPVMGTMVPAPQYFPSFS